VTEPPISAPGLAGPGLTVPGLVDLRPLGQGGYGVVYQAWQVGLGRSVALKVDSRQLGDERDRRRFLREASAAGRLSGHAHIVAVYDAGVTGDGRPYLVMELCPGGSLAERVIGTGPMQPDQVRRIGIGIADALATAHAAGVLHRDVKPANILIDGYGVAKLADFGLAAVLDAAGDSSVTREALTPAYAPPEAFAFARPTEAGDVYGLAATLYALLAARPPRTPSWPPASLAELTAGLRAPVAPIRGVPPDLLAVLGQALEPEPERRTPTAAALRDGLSAVQGPVAGRPDRSITTSAPVTPLLQPGPPAISGPVSSAPAGSVGTVARGPRHATPRRRPARRRSQAPLLALVAAAVLAVLVGVAVLLSNRGQPSATSASGAPPRTAAATPPVRLPASLVPCTNGGGRALCPATPTCWSGLIEQNGRIVPVGTTDCDGEHRWEAYAAVRLSAAYVRLPAATLAARREVASVCTTARMAARARGGVDTTGWHREVEPMEIPGFGWFFYCVASPNTGGVPTGTLFVVGPG
jgi:hypothetical protein